MKRRLYLFSSDLERSAAFDPDTPGDLITDVTGVGIIEAGLGTMRAIEQHTPDEIVFLGTCGAYLRSEISIGSIVVATDAIISSGDIVNEDMRLPTIMRSSLGADVALSSTVIEEVTATGNQQLIRRGTVVCTLGVTETDALATTLSSATRGDVENLEAFSVLHAAGDIPTAIMLGVTNIVGDGGGKDWAANYGRIMTELAESMRLSNR